MNFQIDPLTGDPLPNFTNLQKPGAKNTPVVVRKDLSREEWSALADEKLQELLQTSDGQLLLAAIKESKDRLVGKAVTPIAAQIEDKRNKQPEMTPQEMARRVQFLLAMAQHLEDDSASATVLLPGNVV